MTLNTGKSMEISKDKYGYILLDLLELTVTLVDLWKFPKTGLDKILLYLLENDHKHFQIYGNFQRHVCINVYWLLDFDHNTCKSMEIYLNTCTYGKFQRLNPDLISLITLYTCF